MIALSSIRELMRDAEWNTLGVSISVQLEGNDAPYPAAILETDGLVGYWRLGESAGTVAKDEVGTKDGAYAGGVTLGEDGALASPNTAADFDGTDGRVEIAHDASQLLTTGGTIEAWIFPRTAGGVGAGRIIDKSSGGAGNGGYSFYVAGDPGTGQLRVNLNGSGTRTSSPGSITFGEWNHVALTWDAAGVVSFYVDGALTDVPGFLVDPSTINTTEPLNIGSSPNVANRFFDGLLDEVAIYNVALSADTLAAHYAAASKSIETRGIWLTVQPEQMPSVSAFQRQTARRVLAIRKDKVASVPRGTKVVESDGTAWVVDGYHEEYDDHHRVVMLEAA